MNRHYVGVIHVSEGEDKICRVRREKEWKRKSFFIRTDTNIGRVVLTVVRPE
jgi:hypothetical protein